MDQAQLEAEGWTSLENDGFSSTIGPFWMRGPRGDRIVAFPAEPRHANGHMGILHGGVLMTFADVALGVCVVDAIGAPRCVTAQLQLQFVAAGRIGEFVTCRPELIRKTSQLVFVRGLLLSADRVVASADGVWKILEDRSAPQA